MNSSGKVQYTGALANLARWIHDHRKLTVALWIAAIVVSIGLAQVVDGKFRADYSTPDSESKAAADFIAAQYPGQTGESLDIVWKSNDGAGTADVTARIEELLAQVSAEKGIGEPPPVESAQVSPDGKIGAISVPLAQQSWDFEASDGEIFENLAEKASGDGLEVEMSAGFFQGGGAPSGPAFFAALIILLIAFGSVVAAGLPLVTAFFGLVVGSMLTVVLAKAIAIPDWAPQVADLLAIGVGIDYALLVLTRFRDALDVTDDVRESLAEAVSTAGRSVIVAGSTVVLAVMGLFLVNIGYMRGTALATSLAVLIVMLTAITLLTALLAMLGTRVNKLKLPGVATAHQRRERENDPNHLPLAARWSRQVQAHPWPLAIITAAILIAMAIPAKDMNLGFPDASTNAPTDITYKAYQLTKEGFGEGANGPLIVAVNLTDATGDKKATLAKIESGAKGAADVVAVSPPRMSRSGDAALVIVTPKGAPQAKSTEALVKNLRNNVLPAAVAGTGAVTMLGGATPAYIDQSTYLADHMVIFILGVVLLSLIILLFAFRAPLISLKAGVMNLLSVGAAFGVISLASEGGWFGQLLGVDREVPIAPFVPVIMFSILFGLSMDYEVFLMSRVREEYLRGRETHDAVTIGLARTARVITAAAAIMIAVFMSFALSDLVFLKLMGIGMATAVLVDATLVRMILVPAILQLLGKANWWIPGWLDRILPHWDLEAPEPVAQTAVTVDAGGPAAAADKLAAAESES